MYHNNLPNKKLEGIDQDKIGHQLTLPRYILYLRSNIFIPVRSYYCSRSTLIVNTWSFIWSHTILTACPTFSDVRVPTLPVASPAGISRRSSMLWPCRLLLPAIADRWNRQTPRLSVWGECETDRPTESFAKLSRITKSIGGMDGKVWKRHGRRRGSLR